MILFDLIGQRMIFALSQEGPARGAPGPVRFLCILLSFLGGDLAPFGTGTGSAPLCPWPNNTIPLNSEG
jgi:hypothetical protein